LAINIEYNELICVDKTPNLVSKFEFWFINFHIYFKNSKKLLLALLRLFVCLSVRPSARKNSAPTRRILIKFNIWVFFFENLLRKCNFKLKYDKNNGQITWGPRYTYDNVSPNSSKMTSVSKKKFYRKPKHTRYAAKHFFSENCAFHEIMSKNVPYDNTVRCMRFACWETNALTHTQPGNNGYANAPQYFVINSIHFRIFDIIYLLIVIGLSPGGSSTVHIYTQTVHRTTQITTEQHK
jgi:hypothetical protein